MRRRQWTLALLLVLSLAGSAVARSFHLDERGQRALEDFLRKQMTLDRIPGLTIGYYSGDHFWAKGYGYADLENRTPATENSAYRLASITKSMTAVAVLQLAERGKLDLDDEVQKYVPYYPWKRWPVTIRLLMGHLGGVPHYVDYDVEGHIKEHKYTRDAVAIFAGFDLVAEPGTRYQYSSYGYDLLGAVIEGAAKVPYGEFLRRNLWEPLGMKHTRMDDPDDLIPGRVRGYRLVFGELKNSEFVDISSRFAAGGTRSTVPDLLRYARGLARGKVLSRESIDLMETSMATKDGHFTDYGMGWALTPVNGRFVAYHTGGQPETRTLLVRFPQLDFAFALAYNLEGGNLWAYGRRLYQLLMGEGWNVPAYVGDRVGDAIYRGLWDAFNYGFAYLDRFGRPRAEADSAVARAFAYFNACVHPDSLHADFERVYRRIREGRHPVAGEAFVIVGSWVAARLREAKGAEAADAYHRLGAVPFFADYVRLYRSSPEVLVHARFSPALEELLLKWDPDWRRTATREVQTLNIAAYEDLPAIVSRLRSQFGGAAIYPYFGAEFARAVEDLCRQGRAEDAAAVADEVLALYPKSAEPLLAAALTRVYQGRQQQAAALLQQATEAPLRKERASVSALNRVGQRLFGAGKFDVALRWLDAAEQIYPDAAAFHDTRAAIYLELSRRESEAALQEDPTLREPWKRLKKIGRR